MSIDDIPREDLVAMLKESVWYSGGREELKYQGYSLEVREETCIRDVNYRGRTLYPTAEEAIVAEWIRRKD